MKEQLKKLALDLNERGYRNESLVAAKLFKRAQEMGVPDFEIEDEEMDSSSKEDACESFCIVLSNLFDWENTEERESFCEEMSKVCMQHEVSADFLEEMAYMLEATLEG